MLKKIIIIIILAVVTPDINTVLREKTNNVKPLSGEQLIKLTFFMSNFYSENQDFYDLVLLSLHSYIAIIFFSYGTRSF